MALVYAPGAGSGNPPDDLHILARNLLLTDVGVNTFAALVPRYALKERPIARMLPGPWRPTFYPSFNLSALHKYPGVRGSAPGAGPGGPHFTP